MAIQWLNKNQQIFGYSDLTLLAENDDAALLAYALAETGLTVNFYSNFQ